MNSRKKHQLFVCTECLTVGHRKHKIAGIFVNALVIIFGVLIVKLNDPITDITGIGGFSVEIIGTSIFCIGIFGAIWDMLSVKHVCPGCSKKDSMIPVDIPKGRRLMIDAGPHVNERSIDTTAPVADHNVGVNIQAETTASEGTFKEDMNTTKSPSRVTVAALASFILMIAIIAITTKTYLPHNLIENVDFKNFTYKSTIATGKQATLKNGKFIYYGEINHGEFEIRLNSVEYVDFNNDGQNEALVVLGNDIDGSAGYGEDYFIYGYQNGQLKEFFHTGLFMTNESVKVVNNTIVLSSYDIGNGSTASPEYIEKTTYGWKDGKIDVLSKQKKRTSGFVGAFPEGMPSDVFEMAGKYFELNDVCRGEYPSPSQEKACVDRSTEKDKITKLGWCYEEYDESGYKIDAKWEVCPDNPESFVFIIKTDGKAICEVKPFKNINEAFDKYIESQKGKGIFIHLEPAFLKGKKGAIAIISLDKDGQQLFLFKGTMRQCKTLTDTFNAAYNSKDETNLFETVDGVTSSYGGNPQLKKEAQDREEAIRGGEPISYGAFYAKSRTGMTIGKRYKFNACLSQTPCLSADGLSNQTLCSLDMSTFDDNSEQVKWLESGKEYCGEIVAVMMYGGQISISRLPSVETGAAKDYSVFEPIETEPEEPTIPMFSGGNTRKQLKGQAEKDELELDKTKNISSADTQTMVMRMLEYALDDGGLSHESEIQQTKLQIESTPRPVKGNKKAARAINAKGLASSKDYDFNNAVKMFEEANKLDNSDIEIVSNLGFAYLKQGNLDSAQQATIMALTMSPVRATAWANLGEVFGARGDVNRAVACFSNTFRFSKDRLKTYQFMKKLNETEVVENVKQARAKAINWAEKSYLNI